MCRAVRHRSQFLIVVKGNRIDHNVVMDIHRAGGSDERHNAADTQFIYRLGKEVIVNLKMQLIIPAVADLILSKRHIADGKVKEVVRQVGFFIPCNLDFCFLVTPDFPAL